MHREQMWVLLKGSPGWAGLGKVLHTPAMRCKGVAWLKCKNPTPEMGEEGTSRMPGTHSAAEETRLP